MSERVLGVVAALQVQRMAAKVKGVGYLPDSILAVEEAAIGYRSATATLSAAREREEAAEEAQRQVERAYRVGEASATDLLTTTTELTDARTAQIIARAQRQLQAIALRHALGEAPLPELESLKTGEESS